MKAATPPASASRPRTGHHSFRDQRRALMYLTDSGAVAELTPSDARALINAYGSVRRAAQSIGLPKSTLHDLAADEGKRR